MLVEIAGIDGSPGHRRPLRPARPRQPADRLRGRRLPQRPRPGAGVRRAGRRRPRQQGDRGRERPGGPPDRRPGSAAWSTRWASRSTARARCPPASIPIRIRNVPPPAHAARPGRRQDRSRRPRHQHLRDLLPRPAHGHLRRLGRRQVGAAVDDGALHLARRQRDRPDRRARPRGAGIHRRRAWPRGPGAQRHRRRHLGRIAADAPAGGADDAGDRRVSSATRATTCCA